jgi:hypothetical protein
MICLETNIWENISHKNDSDDLSIPSPRAGHSLESYENTLIVFGGGNRTEFFDDLFSFDIDTSKWDIRITKVMIIKKSREEVHHQGQVILQWR